jgi:hypothetical protein
MWQVRQMRTRFRQNKAVRQRSTNRYEMFDPDKFSVEEGGPASRGTTLAVKMTDKSTRLRLPGSISRAG